MNKQDKISLVNDFARLIVILAFLAIMIALNSCTLTVNPDGSRTYGTDVNAAAKVATIIIESESGK